MHSPYASSSLRLALGLLLAGSSLTACKKAAAPAPAPAKAEANAAAPGAAKAAEAAPAAAPAAAAAEAPKVVENDPLKNGWSLPPRGSAAKEGDRAYVLTQGKDRSYGSTTAVYHLFAHDVGEVKGEVITIKELGGGSFKVTGLFVIPAGAQAATELKVGDMVLAEWASSLKHATVTKIEGDKITVRYTDLPDSWTDDKIIAQKTAREVTKQKEGLQPGSFAIAQDEGRAREVLLVSESGDKWLVRRFEGRVTTFATKDLTALPLKPALKAGQTVLVPWVGVMYKGKVKKVTGTRVEVMVDGIATKDPVVTSLGQVATDVPKDEAAPAAEAKHKGKGAK